MDENMVERVAKALKGAAAAELLETGSVSGRWEGLARAAIEAMREPTEHMLNIGSCYEDPTDLYALEVNLGIRNEGDIARDVYHWMIDAALRDERQSAKSDRAT